MIRDSFLRELARQRIMRAAAENMAAFISRLDPAAIEKQAREDAPLLLPERVLEQVGPDARQRLAALVKANIGLFSESDLGTLLNRILSELPLAHAAVLSRHRDWSLGQLRRLWHALLSLCSQP